MTLLPTKPNLMIERPQQEIANATAEIDEAAHAGLVPQLGMMLRALVAAPMRNRLMLPAVAVFLVIAVTACGQIRLNSWNQPFYDALSCRDLRWDRKLNEDEQQRSAFASLVLHAPPWMLIDAVLDSLEDDSLKRVIDVFTWELKRTGVIYIGPANGHDPLFSRTLHLIEDPATRRLPRKPVAAAQLATA